MHISSIPGRADSVTRDHPEILKNFGIFDVLVATQEFGQKTYPDIPMGEVLEPGAKGTKTIAFSFVAAILRLHPMSDPALSQSGRWSSLRCVGACPWPETVPSVNSSGGPRASIHGRMSRFDLALIKFIADVV